MNKKEIEKELLELWKKRLEIYENTITTKFYNRIGLFGVSVAFLFKIEMIPNNSIGYVILILIIIFLYFVIHGNNLDIQYFGRIYNDLMDSTKKNEINKFKLYERDMIEYMFYCKNWRNKKLVRKNKQQLV
jgi:hypothetical protein